MAPDEILWYKQYTTNSQLYAQLVRHEGKRFKPYTDTVGKLTIGVGRNLTDVGVSASEVDIMYESDVIRAAVNLNTYYPWWTNLSWVRKKVMIDMMFNMGPGTLSQFVNTLKYIKEGNYEKAAVHMLASKWAIQVGRRAYVLAEMMRTGKDVYQ